MAQAGITPPLNSTTIQHHLQHIEHHITHELNSLRVSAEQLQLVRQLQAELQRLQNIQASSPHSHVPMSQTAPLNHTTPMPQAVPLPQATQPTPASFSPLSVPSPSAVAMQRRFMPDPNVSALRAGDARLPDGLTLPPGWTLTPLRSAEHAGAHPPGITPTPTATQSSSQPAPDAPTPQEAPTTVNAKAEGQNNEANDTSGSTATDALPNWQAASAAPTSGQRTESPNQDWTDVTAEGTSDKTDASTAFDAVNEDNVQNTTAEGESSSSSKGKSRAPTVEDAVDEGT